MLWSATTNFLVDNSKFMIEGLADNKKLVTHYFLVDKNIVKDVIGAKVMRQW